MAIIEKHAPGSLCWVELAAGNQSGAKSFYTSLFGWSAVDFPMGPDGVYTMFNLEGRNTSAVYQIDPVKMPGVPPNWTLYVCVESADQSAAKAVEAGGKILAGPFDVYEFGRMAVLLDSTGAAFNLWEPRSHQGTAVAGIPGTFCWADLSTPDAGAAKAFYESVFGWKIEAGQNDTSGYLHIQNGQNFIGGIPPAQFRAPNTPPHWLLYFQVADADASFAKATELGARVLMPPMTMENVGRWSVVADPDGAILALFQPMERK